MQSSLLYISSKIQIMFTGHDGLVRRVQVDGQSGHFGLVAGLLEAVGQSGVRSHGTSRTSARTKRRKN